MSLNINYLHRFTSVLSSRRSRVQVPSVPHREVIPFASREKPHLNVGLFCFYFIHLHSFISIKRTQNWRTHFHPIWAYRILGYNVSLRSPQSNSKESLFLTKFLMRNTLIVTACSLGIIITQLKARLISWPPLCMGLSR